MSTLTTEGAVPFSQEFLSSHFQSKLHKMAPGDKADPVSTLDRAGKADVYVFAFLYVCGSALACSQTEDSVQKLHPHKGTK